MPDSNTFDFNSTDRIPTVGSGHNSTASSPPLGRQEPADTTGEPAPGKSGSDQPAPVVDSQGRILNPRSCVTCRRRKVKCDKLHPCSNCARAHIECIFPGPGRAPRKPRKHVESRDSELLARLRRLEGVVKTLGVEVPLGDYDPKKKHDEGKSQSSARPTLDGGDHSHTSLARKSLDHDTPSSTNSVDGRHTPTNSNLENKFGRLVVTDGRSRYVNTSFWASLNSEVEDLRGILGDDSDVDDGDTPDSVSHHPSNHHGWMFQFSSMAVDMLALHPQPTQIAVYWNVFRDRVDPLVKVLHIPSITPTILASSSHLGNLSKGFEALLMAIYYAATTSLSPAECRTMLGEERDALLDKYRFGVEQALARAGFLTAAEMVIIQAFVLFLMCLRRNSSARIIWTLTGLLVRMSQTMGIHRDGTHFNLPPFEIEMRRRLWWQICLLDARASEDHGCDPTIVEESFDTKMPLNVNDTDIAPGMPEFPKEHLGCTDMSFCLIRFEVANTFRRLNYVPPGPREEHGDYSGATLQQKEQWIQQMHDTLEEKYLKHCDMGVPLYWVTATVSRLIMSKLWLVVYHPMQRSDTGHNLSEDIRNKLFIISLENIEYGILLQTETRTMKWGWLFRTYMQWHALALLLSELCKRTRGPLIDRAWTAVGQVHEYLRDLNSKGGNMLLWKPIDRLMAKAKAARQKALDEDAALEGNKHEAAPSNKLVPGSVAHMLQNMRQDARPGQTPGSMAASTPDSNQSRSQAVYGSIANDPNKILTFAELQATSSGSPTVSKPSQPPFGMPAPMSMPTRVESPTSYLDTATTLPPQAPTLAGVTDWTALARNGTMDSTMSFGADNPNNFTLSAYNNNNPQQPFPADDMQMADMSMTFDANGELDWANWDSMVRQFGMDVDSGEVLAPNAPVQGAWNGGAYNGMMPGPSQGGMPMGQTDWF